MSLGKLILGTFLGIMLAAGVCYAGSEYFRARNAASNIGEGFDKLNADAKLRNDELKLQNDKLDAQIRELDPKRTASVKRIATKKKVSKYPECEDDSRTAAISVAQCEARLEPGAPTVPGCSAFFPRSAAYRECQARTE